MPKVTFAGDPRDHNSGPEVITLWGQSFPKGQAVDVTEAVAVRARKHSHFTVTENVEPAVPTTSPKRTKKART